MKMKSILIITIVLLLMTIPMSQIISAESDKDISDSIINNNPVTDDDKGKLESYFLGNCFIFGTYEVLEYANFLQGIQIKNPSGEYTINVFGWWSYEDRFLFVKACWLRGSHFIGYANNGRVIGFVLFTCSIDAP